jgi:hypothetical protein
LQKLYDFNERLGFSKGRRQDNDLATIKTMIAGCDDVQIAPVDLDRQGVDYIATLRGKAQVLIDAKARDAGCSQHWHGEPELALEDWSVLPENGNAGKVGWTLDERKMSDLILFTFAPQDTPICYLISFQLLRIAFRQNCISWRGQYKKDIQDSGTWRSRCVFVPISVVFAAIQSASISYQTGNETGRKTP